MSYELLATVSLIALYSLVTIITYVLYKKERIQLMGTIEDRIHDELQGALDAIGDVFSGIVSNPTVKSAMSIIGKKGGEAKAERGLVDSMAIDVLDSPQFAAVKMGAESLLGVDVDKYIEDHGAVKTLAAARQLANALGVNFDDILAQGMAGLGGSLSQPSSGGKHPYM